MTRTTRPSQGFLSFFSPSLSLFSHFFVCALGCIAQTNSTRVRGQADRPQRCILLRLRFKIQLRVLSYANIYAPSRERVQIPRTPCRRVLGPGSKRIQSEPVRLPHSVRSRQPSYPQTEMTLPNHIIFRSPLDKQRKRKERKHQQARKGKQGLERVLVMGKSSSFFFLSV